MQKEGVAVIPKPHYILRAIRSQPHLYSALCKARLFYSRHVTGYPQRAEYRREKSLFSMTALEARHCEELVNQGFTVFHDFFDTDAMDRIQEKADSLFRGLKLNFNDGYSIQNKRRASLEGLTYEDLESDEKVIFLKDPLLQIPECIDIAFNEVFLKVVTNFLGYISPVFTISVGRDFPHDPPTESSNFHKDFDDADSVQAFIYLVDIDDTRGPFIYVPRTNRYDVRSCRPRLNRDLGINANDGRVSDKELKKYYPQDSWAVVKAKRGSILIFHGNGFHKGPAWLKTGNLKNRPRTAVRINFMGRRIGSSGRGKGTKMKREDYDRLSRLQKLFASEYAVTDEQ